MKHFLKPITLALIAICISVSCKKEPQAIHVTGISLDKTEIELAVGKAEALSAIVLPDNASDKTVSWSSSDPSGATVYDGTVTAVKVGEATIEATSSGFSAECTVNVFFDAPCVDLGLGVKWASFNVGATTPEEYGLYFEWGNIIGYAPNGNSFSHSFNSTDYAETPGAELTGDINTAAYDAAKANWGGKWRMPTKAEFDDLLSKCDRKWYDGKVDQYNESPVAGYEFIGKGDWSGNSIFFPAAGFGNGTNLSYAGTYGYCWTGSYHGVNLTYCLGIGNGYASADGDIDRYYGLTVRPVSD